MIVPIFTLSQDDEYVLVSVKAPMCKVSEATVEFEGGAEGHGEICFAAPPYLLHLYLPGQVVEDGRESAEYDADAGTFLIRAPKAKKGQVFQGLHLITKLITPPGRDSAEPLLSQLTEEEAEEVEGLNPEGYGFGGRRHGVVKALREELSHIFQIQDLDAKTREGRARASEELELEVFHQDHYLSDLYDCPEINDLLELKLPWADEDWSEEFTDEEKRRLKELPKRPPPLVLETNLAGTMGTLLELLFALAYDQRTTEAEGSVESGWTIARLSPSLAALTHFDDDEFDTERALRASLVHCVRRSLVFPLYRNWELSQRCLGDAVSILMHGRIGVIKALLRIHAVFAASDNRYLLNDLFVTDYLLWSQHLTNDDLLHSFRDRVIGVASKLSKAELLLDLETLEMTAEMAILGTGPGQNGALLEEDKEEEEEANEGKKEAAKQNGRDETESEKTEATLNKAEKAVLDSDDDEPSS